MSSCYSSRTFLHRGCRRKRKKREKLSSQQPLSSALQPVGSCSRITAPRGTLKMLIQGCDEIVTVSSEYRWWPEREERRIQRGMDEDVIDLRGCLWATFACLFSGCQRWQEASFRTPSPIHQIFEWGMEIRGRIEQGWKTRDRSRPFALVLGVLEVERLLEVE